jgi:hypothetical protein
MIERNREEEKKIRGKRITGFDVLVYITLTYSEEVED